MGYTIRDTNGHLADFGTNSGINDLYEFCKKFNYPNTRGFIVNGAGLITEKWEKEVMEASPKNKDIKSMFEELRVLLSKGNLVLILQDGIN